MTIEDIVSSIIGVILIILFLYLMAVGIDTLRLGLNGISMAILNCK